MPLAVRTAAAQLACPYIGLDEDPATRCIFPSRDHRCHRPALPVLVEPGFQAGVCLTSGYAACPTFQAATPPPGAPHGPSRRRLVAGGALLLVAVAGLVGLKALLGDATAQATTDPPQAPAIAPASRTATLVRYRVREGDQLADVAAFFGSRPEDVIRLNGLPTAGTLTPGQELLLPIGP